MSDERRGVKRKLDADEQKSAHEESHDQSALDGASNEEPTPQIINCFAELCGSFERLFEWLSLPDLLSLRQTNKRFKQEVDKFVAKEYSPGVKLGYGKVKITDMNIDRFRNLDSNLAKSIKEIEFRVLLLSNEQINDLKGILGQIGVLQMKSWQIWGEFYESFFQFCPNVKRLTLAGIRKDAKIIGTSNDWLHREFPNLEYFDYDIINFVGFHSPEIPELKTFFELNRNIQTFATTLRVLRANQEWLLGSDIRFNVLKIRGNCAEVRMDNVYALVDTLHDQGFYKRLHFSGDYIDEEHWNAIATMSAIEILYLKYNRIHIELPISMSCVRELGISDYRGGFKEYEKSASNLMNVERVIFKRSSFKTKDILSFIRHSARVKEIRVEDLSEEPFFANGIIDLPSLNKERANLAGACKQTIYVPENIYVARKWAKLPMECPLVELKRLANCEWKPFFTF